MPSTAVAVGDRVQVIEEHDDRLRIARVRTPPGTVKFVNDRIADVELDDGNHQPYLLAHLAPAEG
jgi:hypothetical protein